MWDPITNLWVNSAQGSWPCLSSLTNKCSALPQIWWRSFPFTGSYRPFAVKSLAESKIVWTDWVLFSWYDFCTIIIVYTKSLLQIDKQLGLKHFTHYTIFSPENAYSDSKTLLLQTLNKLIMLRNNLFVWLLYREII